VIPPTGGIAGFFLEYDYRQFLGRVTYLAKPLAACKVSGNVSKWALQVGLLAKPATSATGHWVFVLFLSKTLESLYPFCWMLYMHDTPDGQ